jgi:predicted heme/steroid binding protein
LKRKEAKSAKITLWLFLALFISLRFDYTQKSTKTYILWLNTCMDLRQLAQHDSDADTFYIAYNGVVYDVTACPHWRTGLHQNQHFPGQDLTGELPQAPHGDEVFKHPAIKVIENLSDS